MTELCGGTLDLVLERLVAVARAPVAQDAIGADPPRSFRLLGMLTTGDRRIRCLQTGEMRDVAVRRRVVNATYLEATIPATTAPPFDVADDARCVTAGELAEIERPDDGYVVIGSGKTGMDAVQFLLRDGVDPDRIQWIRPRDPWLLNRKYYQGGQFLLGAVEGTVLQLEAASESRTVDEFFERCEGAGVFLRLDESLRPTMIRGATTHERELAELRQIHRVVRKGRVRRIERDRIVLDQGEIPTSPGHVHVHCATDGVPAKRPVPIFQPDRVIPQLVRVGSASFSYALIGYLEASDRSDEEKNRLAPPNAFTNTPLDWVRSTAQTLITEAGWSADRDLTKWMNRTRLNVVGGMMKIAAEPEGQAILQRLGTSVGAGIPKMQAMTDAASAAERTLFWPPID